MLFWFFLNHTLTRSIFTMDDENLSNNSVEYELNEQSLATNSERSLTPLSPSFDYSSSPSPTPSTSRDIIALLRLAKVCEWCTACLQETLQSIATGRPVIVLCLYARSRDTFDDIMQSCVGCKGKPQACRSILDAPHFDEKDKWDAKNIARLIRRQHDVVSPGSSMKG